MNFGEYDVLVDFFIQVCVFFVKVFNVVYVMFYLVCCKEVGQCYCKEVFSYVIIDGVFFLNGVMDSCGISEEFN